MWWPRPVNASVRRCRRRRSPTTSTITNTDSELLTDMAALTVVSDAAGRIRLRADWFRGDTRRAVAIEDAVEQVPGVRAVHAYPRTASIVVWYSPKRCDKASV